MLSGLRVRLFGLVLLALAPAAGLIVYSSWQQRHDAANGVRQDALTVTQLLVAQQEQVLEGSRELLVSLAALSRGIDVASLNPDSCGAAFATLLTQFDAYSNLGLVAPNGDIVCSAIPSAQVINAADRPWFQRAQQSHDLAVGDYQVGRITGQKTLNLAHPILNRDGNVGAVVFLALDLERLNQRITEAKLPPGAVFTLRDRNGTVLVQVPYAPDVIGQSLPDASDFQAALKTGEGVAELRGPDDTNRLYAFTPIGDPEKVGLYASVGLPTGTAFAQANSTLRRGLIGLGLVAGLALMAAWIGGDLFVIKRARALVAASEKLRAGDLSARTAQPHDRSELGVLASSFDAMAGGLQRRESERDIALAELARRNEELEAFTHSVSHDLKEPLRTIEAFSRFLLEDHSDQLDEQGRDYLGRLGSASARLKQLIDELLTLSRVGRGMGSPRALEIATVVEDIKEGLRYAIEQKDAVVEVEPGLPRVFIDPSRAEQVFGNLISNALKFNQSERPRVRIGMRGLEDGRAVLYVADNGIGIDPEYRELIFGVFQRLHRREDYEGTGAGLAIVKRAVEVAGGRIWVESSPGQGSTFVFSLPLADEAATQQRAA